MKSKSLQIVFFLIFLSVQLFSQENKNGNIITNTNQIFTKDVIVKDINGNKVNLRNIEITKDTVLVFIWCKTCGVCIRYLNYYKTKNDNYQIMAVGVAKDSAYLKEKEIILKNAWPFSNYFELDNNLAKYFYEKAYYKHFYRLNPISFGGFPIIYMFVNNKLTYTNPFHEEKAYSKKKNGK